MLARLRIAVSLVVSLALALVLVGCPGPTFVVQSYSGPQRAAATIATMRVNGSDAVRLVTLDDEDVRAPLESDSRLHIELLPGRHTVTVETRAAQPSDVRVPLAFDAEAGKVYRVVMVNAEARVFEVERGSDKTMRDVTVAPTAAP